MVATTANELVASGGGDCEQAQPSELACCGDSDGDGDRVCKLAAVMSSERPRIGRQARKRAHDGNSKQLDWWRKLANDSCCEPAAVTEKN